MRSFLKAFLVLIILTASSPLVLRADTLTLSPSNGSYSVGKSFPVTVYVSSVSQSVNAVSGTITFPTDKLQVVSVSKASSILTLWVSDPTFSNSDGTVSFEGVVPNPGFQGSAGRIITINFKVVGSGAATVKWSTASELANDGSGTNILRNLNTASFILGAGSPTDTIAPVAVPTTPARAPAGGVLVTSSTYPDQKKWYTADQGKFSWRLSDNVTAIKILVGKLPNSDATVLYDPPIEEKTVSDIEDGVWYFHLSAKTAQGYGPTTHYKFNVDSTAPDSFDIKAIDSDDQTDPKPKFSFNAVDSTSGIDHYTVQIDSSEAVTWRDDGSGIYEPRALGPGSHTLLAKAYDAAGNSTPASIDFTVVPIKGPKITSYTEKVTATSPLVVRGITEPGYKAEIRLTKAGLSKLVSGSLDSAITQSVASDENGAFSLAIDTDKLPSGAYDLSAVSIDKRGARSEPTAPATVLINASWLQSIGSSVLSTLAVAVPVISLLVLLALALMHGFHRVRMTNRKFRSELQNVERLVDKAFILLKEDVEDSIRLLEHTKSKRRLTGEEEAIIERFRANIRDADKVIHNEMKKIEREID
jgi:hypothetical protein